MYIDIVCNIISFYFNILYLILSCKPPPHPLEGQLTNLDSSSTVRQANSSSQALDSPAMGGKLGDKYQEVGRKNMSQQVTHSGTIRR